MLLHFGKFAKKKQMKLASKEKPPFDTPLIVKTNRMKLTNCIIREDGTIENIWEKIDFEIKLEDIEKWTYAVDKDTRL